jgi:hypothetical protein
MELRAASEQISSVCQITMEKFPFSFLGCFDFLELLVGTSMQK